jgi:hypothetical protein
VFTISHNQIRQWAVEIHRPYYGLKEIFQMARTAKKVTEAPIQVEAPKPVKVKIDSDYLIPVRSNVGGVLYYKSKKTGYEETWDESGTVIEMEYGELVSMRNSQKKFFVNNWITIEDTDDYTAEQIYKALNVDKYYVSNGLYETIDDIFDFSAKKIGEIVPNLPKAVKETITTKAYTMLADNDSRLDSKAKTEALEKALGISFDMDEVT